MAQLFVGAAAGIDQGHIRSDLAGQDFEQAELAELVGDGLIDDRLGGSIRIQLFAFFPRAGEVIHNGVQKNGGAQSAHGASAEHRADVPIPDADVQGSIDLFQGEFHGIQILFHQLFAGTGRILHQFLVQLVQAIGFSGRNRDLRPFAAFDAIGLFGDDVDDAGHLLAFHHRHSQGGDGIAEAFAQLVEGAVVIRVLLICLGNIDGAGLAGLDKRFPRLFGTDIDPVLGSDADNARIRYPQRLLNFAGKIEEAGSIKDIDLDLVVIGIDGGGGDTDLALDFFRVIIAGGVAFHHLAEPVGHSREVKDALGQAGFAGAAMAQQTNIADLI